jgi:hypothetical protein
MSGDDLFPRIHSSSHNPIKFQSFQHGGSLYPAANVPGTHSAIYYHQQLPRHVPSGCDVCIQSENASHVVADCRASHFSLFTTRSLLGHFAV